MKEQKTSFWHKDSTRSVIASLLSILIGLLVGAVLILIVGVSNKSLGLKSAWASGSSCSDFSAPGATPPAR